MNLLHAVDLPDVVATGFTCDAVTIGNLEQI